jgi:small subunit ribosomal protein S27e
MKKLVTMPKTRFLKVVCRKCRNEQIIFSNVSTVVKCLGCDNELAIPTGGEARIKAKIVEVLS